MTRREKKVAALSPSARKVWDRLLGGAWYDPYNGGAPKAMQELVKAGLVGIGGRVQVIRAAYLPIGTKPLRREKFPVA